ncbi:MAG TPA: hypothetical protein VMV92_38990 [Streptosporangiaceae bacterium]|nr:hypothetical protein [Streptosporangiaceae bacterium]
MTSAPADGPAAADGGACVDDETCRAGWGFPDEYPLVAAASRLGAATVAGWSEAEQRLAEQATQATQAGLEPQAELGRRHAAFDAAAFDIQATQARIQAGEDPLGEAFCDLRDQARRRPLGQTFTPPLIIGSMISWAAGTGCRPARVVDPGSGSARFLIAAGRRWPEAALVGVEIDPAAAIVGRASLAAAGLAARSRVILGDYRCARLPPAAGPTLFLGNPPYVRHHQIPPCWKDWLRRTARAQGLPASGLAGLHAHFFLATALHAVPGDLGVLITAAEWLDVNYGRLVRSLLLGTLGGQSVHLVEPTAAVFADASATSVIACFRPGAVPGALRLRRVASAAQLGSLAGGTRVQASALATADRWGPLLRTAVPVRAGRPGGLAAGHVELGELCQVHRGQVTGANAVWITAGRHALVPARFLFPAVTRARELFAAGAVLPAVTPLRRVIDLPADLAGLVGPEQAAVARFLRAVTAAGAADSYVARHRRPWWRVRLAQPPPILASYMARRPPVFVRNLAGARYLNIAHGLYPREPLAPGLLDALASFLSRSVTAGQGRVYAGGLIKFEPGEMQRLPVPGPALLAAWAPAPAPGQPDP